MKRFAQRPGYTYQKYKLLILASVWLAASMTVIVLLPGLLVRHHPSSLDAKNGSAVIRPSDQSIEKRWNPDITLYISKQKKVISLPLETYLKGVVAAEMPAYFEPEALKAQAIAARTYILHRFVAGETEGVPVKGALVTDTVAHQAYKTDEQLRKDWGAAAEANLIKIGKAVEETRGLVLTYEGKLINALFFSTSNGYTENSEDYWGSYVPYLRSVPSPWDVPISPRYKETVSMPYGDFLRELGAGAVSAASSRASFIRVTERTEGRRIGAIRVGDQLLTGKEMRERLGLNSSQFTWKLKGSRIEITTYGYGHGVGMSQWGANGMAEKGMKASQILKYYYSGVKLEDGSKFVSSQKPAL
ncbi:stage II sporulation protein D [Paenibacillus gansuensis]|uniref:Stage II sporulation protein D n=1 Tax=Paenibacillus gansuensis TaxID=306542 RepID=A0ABW5PL46_9BACL